MEQHRPATEKEIAITDWAWRAMLLFADLDPTPLEREGDSLVGIIEDDDGILHECVIPAACPDAFNYVPWAQRIMNKFFDRTVRKAAPMPELEVAANLRAAIADALSDRQCEC